MSIFQIRNSRGGIQGELWKSELPQKEMMCLWNLLTHHGWCVFLPVCERVCVRLGMGGLGESMDVCV